MMATAFPRASKWTKPAVEVPMLSPHLSCIAEARCEWIVARIHTQHVKVTASRLLAAGLTYCLPQTCLIRPKTNGTKVRVFRPLFGGVLFAECEAEDLLRRQFGSFAGLIPVPNQKRLVRDLSNIHLVLDASPDIGLHPVVDSFRRDPRALRVQVVRGPFEGFEGDVLRVKDSTYTVTVGVELLGQYTTIDFDEADLEKL